MTDTSLLLRQDSQDNSGVTTLTLNRPQSRNSLSQEMLQALLKAFAELAADPKVRVVILAGAGPAFCASALPESPCSGCLFPAET